MAKARPNPLGLDVPGARLVRVGQGKATHMFNFRRQEHSCRSGVNAGRGGPSGAKPVVRDAPRASKLTCYRCIKLAEINKAAGRKPWEPGSE
jgi:hypothetical protein